MGALSTSLKQLLQRFSWIRSIDVVMFEGPNCRPRHTALIARAGYSYVVALMNQPPERLRAAEEWLSPLAARQLPAARRLEQCQGEWVRSSLWRSQAIVKEMDWPLARQVWLLRTETFNQPSPPQPDSVPVEIEDRYYLTNLRWDRFDGAGILGMLKGPTMEKCADLD